MESQLTEQPGARMAFERRQDLYGSGEGIEPKIQIPDHFEDELNPEDREELIESVAKIGSVEDDLKIAEVVEEPVNELELNLEETNTSNQTLPIENQPVDTVEKPSAQTPIEPIENPVNTMSNQPTNTTENQPEEESIRIEFNKPPQPVTEPMKSEQSIESTQETVQASAASPEEVVLDVATPETPPTEVPSAAVAVEAPSETPTESVEETPVEIKVESTQPEVLTETQNNETPAEVVEEQKTEEAPTEVAEEKQEVTIEAPTEEAKEEEPAKEVASVETITESPASIAEPPAPDALPVLEPEVKLESESKEEDHFEKIVANILDCWDKYRATVDRSSQVDLIDKVAGQISGKGEQLKEASELESVEIYSTIINVLKKISFNLSIKKAGGGLENKLEMKKPDDDSDESKLLRGLDALNNISLEEIRVQDSFISDLSEIISYRQSEID